MTQDPADPVHTLELCMRHDQADFKCPPGPDVTLCLENVRRVLGAGPVSGPQLKHAITEVEDLIMPVLGDMNTGERLLADSSSFAGVLGLMLSPGDSSATIESLEHLFNDLADHATGSPVAWRHAGEPGSLALELLLLREVMHHGGFGSVALA